MNNIFLENFICEHTEGGTKGYKFYKSLSESDLPNISDKVIAALYKSALEKYNYIDFGDIPLSKGDITKFKHFEIINGTLEMLYEIKDKSGIHVMKELDVIKTALTNVINHKKEFTVGFLQDNNIIILIYNTAVASIISGLNLLISTMVEYVRTPNATIEPIITNIGKHKSLEFSLFNSLEEFNKIIEKGELKKLSNGTQNKDNFLGSAVGGAAIVLGSLIMIVPVVRELIYFVYNTRMNISNYLDQQAEFLKLNANAIKFNGDIRTVDNRKQVISKQEKLSKKLVSIADKFRLDFQKGNKETKTELAKKVSVDSIQSSLTDIDDSNSSFTLV